MNNAEKTPRLPFWFPEGARRAKGGETNGLVSYLAPNGKTRRYIAGERESKFYASLFRGTRRYGAE